MNVLERVCEVCSAGGPDVAPARTRVVPSSEDADVLIVMCSPCRRLTDRHAAHENGWHLRVDPRRVDGNGPGDPIVDRPVLESRKRRGGIGGRLRRGAKVTT